MANGSSEEIDVVLLTKNSIKPCLEKCIQSIYEEIPVKRLIVVDGGSVDGTIEFCSRFPSVKIVMDVEGNRATARQKAINEVETEWFAFVDSDVILCEKWFSKAINHVEKDVGAVWGVAVPIQKHIYNIVNALSRFYRKSTKQILVMQILSQRYMMHDTLIRTDLVKDIEIPKDLHIWEDEFIGRHIIKKGFRFIKTEELYCFHDLCERGVDTSILKGYLARKYNIWSFKAVLLRFLLAVPEGLWILAMTGDFKAAVWQIKNYVYLFKGWLSASF